MERYISSQWSRLSEDVDLRDLSNCLCHGPSGVLVDILLFDILFPFRSVGKIGIKQQISPEYRSSIEMFQITPVYRSSKVIEEKKTSVAADEMAVKRQSADTNFLEKKIGL